MDADALETYRSFLKDSIRLTVDFSQTDQSRGVPPPPSEKPVEAEATRLDLAAPFQWQGVPGVDLASAIRDRESRRRFL